MVAFVVPTLAAHSLRFERTDCSVSDASYPTDGDKPSHHDGYRCSLYCSISGSVSSSSIAPQAALFEIAFRNVVAATFERRGADSRRFPNVIFFVARGPPILTT